MNIANSTGRTVLVLACFMALLSCGSKKYFLEDEELARFDAAGPVIPEVDQDALLRSLPSPGPYLVVPGDVLVIRGPRTMFEESPEQATGGQAADTQVTRVDGEGRILVPLAGALEVGGQTLPEIEARIADAVYPKYLIRPPSIVVSVAEHHRVAVSVVGAVEEPGLHYLRSDQLSLYGALSEAGGIVRSVNLVVGARLIRVYRSGAQAEPDPLLLPVKGLNVPVADVALVGGERIEVERYEPDTFTVVGLVSQPGAFDYPPEVRYNLMQALAIAGGVDRIAKPPYATVFRRDRDGEILPATFEIDGDGLVEASEIMIKPGDVIAIQHTPATWSRAFAANVFRINFGWFFDNRE
jgi:polysaccharide biosynthesis/export protein